MFWDFLLVLVDFDYIHISAGGIFRTRIYASLLHSSSQLNFVTAVQTTFFSSKTLIKRIIPTTQEYMYLYAYYANNAYIKYLLYLTMPNLLT